MSWQHDVIDNMTQIHKHTRCRFERMRRVANSLITTFTSDFHHSSRLTPFFPLLKQATGLFSRPLTKQRLSPESCSVEIFYIHLNDHILLHFMHKRRHNTPCNFSLARIILTFNNSIRRRQLRVIIRFVFRHFQSNVCARVSVSVSVSLFAVSPRSATLPQNGRLQWYRSLLSLARNTCNSVTNFLRRYCSSVWFTALL